MEFSLYLPVACVIFAAVLQSQVHAEDAACPRYSGLIFYILTGNIWTQGAPELNAVVCNESNLMARHRERRSRLVPVVHRCSKNIPDHRKRCGLKSLARSKLQLEDAMQWWRLCEDVALWSVYSRDVRDHWLGGLNCFNSFKNNLSST